MTIYISKMPNWKNHEVTGLASDYSTGAIIERHKHDGFHQIVYASKGVIRVSSEEASWVVPPGRAIWMPAGRYHKIDCYGAVYLRSLYIDGNTKSVSCDCAVWSVSALMHEIILRLIEQPRESIRSHLIALLQDEINSLDILPLKLPQPKDRRLLMICDTINKNPADARRLRDWAWQLGYSERNLIRQFQADTGLTFRQWRRQARLLLALERLANREPVTTIALELGYESASAFGVAFRETFGVTPGQYFAQSLDLPKQ